MVGYCDSEVERGHEVFECLEAKGHSGDHLGMVYRGPPCPECGSLDEHAEKCSLIGLMEDQTLPLIEIRWNQQGELQTWVP